MASNKPTESSSAETQHPASYQSMYCMPFLGHHSFKSDPFSLVDPVDPEASPSEHQTFTQGQSANPQNATLEHAVRFNSVLQEIEPEYSLHTDATLLQEGSIPEKPLSPEAQEEIRSLSQSLQQSHLQHRRMSNYAFEPVSLPVSRVRGCRNAFYFVPVREPKSDRLSSLTTLPNPCSSICLFPIVSTSYTVAPGNNEIPLSIVDSLHYTPKSTAHATLPRFLRM
jgi:hypothetical protein